MRIEFLEIGGRKYPLSFSLATAERITSKYKNVEQLMRILQDKNVSDFNKLHIVCEVLSAMMYSGAEYYNALKMQPFEGAHIEDGKFKYLSPSQLSFVLDMNEDVIKEVTEKVKRCCDVGNQKEIHTKAVGSSAKKKKKRR